MRFVRIGSRVFNLDIQPDPLMETRSIILEGEEAEAFRRHLEAIGVEPWRPRRAAGSPESKPRTFPGRQ